LTKGILFGIIYDSKTSVCLEICRTFKLFERKEDKEVGY